MVWSHSTRLCLLKVPPPLKSVPGFQGQSRSTLYQKLSNGCLLEAGAERIGTRLHNIPGNDSTQLAGVTWQTLTAKGKVDAISINYSKIGMAARKI